MQKFKKWWAGLVSLALILSMLCACGNTAQEQETATESLRLYASFYPIYALTAMITKDIPDLYLNCLVQPQDGCLRAYDLSDWDFALLERSADAIIMGGEGLERFESLLYIMGEEGPAVCTVLDGVELTTQRGVNTLDDSESHWLDPNPHIYMKIDGALEILSRIAVNLSVMDPRYEKQYGENLTLAQENLEQLRASIHEISGDCAGTKVIVMSEALVYVAQEFDLDMAVCIDRESGEALSGNALEECLDWMEESEARLVLIEKQAPQALLEALKSSGYAVAAMDVLSTRSATEGAEGFIKAFEYNAEALAQAIAETDRQ